MVNVKEHKFLFAAGGTGGHIFPALSIAEEIKKIDNNSQFLFVGTKDRLEASLIPNYGYQFKSIWISGLSRGFDPKNLLFPIKLFVSLIQSILIIKNFSPSVVIGTGGYVCAPVIFIASILKVKTVLHESNSYPGLVTRLLSSKVDCVFTTFDITQKWLKKGSKVEKFGNPVRKNLKDVSKEVSLKFFDFSSNRKTLLVIGGSLGASSINNAIAKSLKTFFNLNIQLIWQTGEKDYENIQNLVNNLSSEEKAKIWIGKFIEKMEYAYNSADLVICRAGATTISELTYLGKPAILIPYPFATEDHQRINAETLQIADAAIMIKDSELDQKFEKTVTDLIFDDNRLKIMSQNSLKLRCPEAGELIARKIIELIN